ncbi:MAG: cadherin repeat domain-containing protein [Candidatus Thiodiazotropha lotti]|nr:cadherin repeat domain-containing protein [Candidatus Thiodiazotropha lotti]MCW4221954.1 cadherin repeat domain-containing protein [Candidatus Thiodiazotropha lotti]
MPVIRIDADDVYCGRNSDYIHVNAIRRTGTWELTNDYRLAGRFALSAIPAGSTINQVDVELTPETPGNTTELHHILPYNADGSGDAITDTGQTFYDRCGIVANSYATTAFPAAGLMTVSDLGAQANADIQARIGSTFNLAMRQVTEAAVAFTGTALDGATAMMTLVIDYTESGGGSNPSIADVNTNNVVELGSTNNVINGANFEATQNNGQVRINTQADGLGFDLAVIETTWNNGLIEFDISVGLPPGAAYVFVENNSGNENAVGHGITLTVPAGYESFTYDGSTVAEPSETVQEMALEDFTLTMANGDIPIIETTTAVWSTGGSYSQATPATVTGQYYVWDASTDTMHGPAAFTLAAKPGLSAAALSQTALPAQRPYQIDWHYSTNVGNGTDHIYLSESITPPGETDHLAGTGAAYYENNTVATTGVQSGSATGLTPNTQYYLHVRQDNQGVVSDPITSAAFSTDPAPDVTAPVFSAGPAAANPTTSGHDIQATLDEDGTIYAVRLPDGATAPSSAQVRDGQDSTGSPAPEAKSVSATAAVQASMTFNTGSASTAYDYYVVAEDDETTPNIQASPTLVNATTSAGADITPDAFAFTDVVDAVRSTEQISNAITVAGVDAGQNVPLSVTGGEYRVNAGAWSSAPTNVQLGDQIELRHTSSGSYSTAVNTTLALNTVVTDTFTSTTIANSAPVINNQIFSILDGAIATSTIGPVVATDTDELIYSITAGNAGNDWTIDANTGVLEVVNALDIGRTAAYSLTVQVEDPGALTDTATITVNVIELPESSNSNLSHTLEIGVD